VSLYGPLSGTVPQHTAAYCQVRGFSLCDLTTTKYEAASNQCRQHAAQMLCEPKKTALGAWVCFWALLLENGQALHYPTGCSLAVTQQ
jgi:hypothetical protein